MINELFDELSTISRWLFTVSTWNKSELMSYGLQCLVWKKILHSSRSFLLLNVGRYNYFTTMECTISLLSCSGSLHQATILIYFEYLIKHTCLKIQNSGESSYSVDFVFCLNKPIKSPNLSWSPSLLPFIMFFLNIAAGLQVQVTTGLPLDCKSK